MTSNKQELIKNKLSEMRQKYKDELPLKMIELEICWDELLADTTNKDNVINFYRLVHTLAGTAPTFGFVELGAIAREIEVLVTPILDGEEKTYEVMGDINSCLDRIFECVKSVFDNGRF